jgi:hypothetical protein
MGPEFHPFLMTNGRARRFHRLRVLPPSAPANRSDQYPDLIS